MLHAGRPVGSDSVGALDYGRCMTVPVALVDTDQHATDESVPEETATVVAGTLSPSRASDFMVCPLLYRFRARPSARSPSAVATRARWVHAVLERLFASASERTLDHPACCTAWEGLLDVEPVSVASSPSIRRSPGARQDGQRSRPPALLFRRDPQRLEPADRECTSNGPRLRLGLRFMSPH